MSSLNFTLQPVGLTTFLKTRAESIIDCNSVTKHSIDEIVEMLRIGRLKHKPEIPVAIVEKLRAAVIASPIVENNIKEMLR